VKARKRQRTTRGEKPLEDPQILQGPRLDFGIFMVSASVLLLEMLLTRVFSVTMYYHLSFMVVSLAMLGLAASALAVGVLARRLHRDSAATQLAWGAVLLAITSVLAVGVAFRVPVVLESTTANWLRIGLIFACVLVPFLAGGFVIALAFTRYSERANRLYFFDLLGAGMACLVFIPATDTLGAPSAVLLGAAIGGGAGVLFAWRERPWVVRGAATVTCLLVGTLAANLRWDFYDVRVAKGRAQDPVLALAWNSFSRVEVRGGPDMLQVRRRPLSYGLSARLDPTYSVREVYIEYDASALTQITAFDGSFGGLAHLGYDVTSAPYHLRRYHNVLIVGAGGGRDALTALSLGSSPVTAVEVNPLTIDLVRGQFRRFAGGIYDAYPGVRVVNDEGRSFVRSSSEQYDLIQMSLVDTWAASAAGAYALAENSLYTVEAFEDFVRHLSPDGVLAISRWFPQTLAEPLRVVSLAIEALRRAGITEPALHFLIVHTNEAETRVPSLGTILIRRAPFPPDEVERLQDWARRLGFIVSYSPEGIVPGSRPTRFHQLLSSQAAAFVAAYPYDLSVVSDDRPFFFDRVPLLRWILHQLSPSQATNTVGELTLGAQTLLISLVGSGACTALFLLLPALGAGWIGRGAVVTVPRGRLLLWGIYFTSLGLGFIAVEMVLIQRLGLFLGYPAYALSVVLCTLLLASGLGSMLAGRWTRPPVAAALIALTLLIVVVAATLQPLLHATFGLATPLRIAVAILIVAPLGVLMGAPFPSGLRLAGRQADSLVPWGWALNGSASVLGSTLTVLVSMNVGFRASLVAAAVAYATALAAAVVVIRRR